MVNVIIQYTDIWSFDMVTWHFVAANTLISGRDPETNKHHDRQFIAELGAVQPCRPATTWAYAPEQSVSNILGQKW
ncbi:hypothetical protein I7I50_03940 [Histoplasma capsulatum G186AR]|uniref:Uncharacterized protein n=1 Tax=Ajellomyces capsulatus TaxID=5037 RepID=A0A8H8CXM4_AJECA|nr:hypothetical protein I7I52_04848 [Histoplasma capsulatum]QSS74960.1 hypothetical protein I7I50_03940 [Histoplasma capsulatum G186AR]